MTTASNVAVVERILKGATTFIAVFGKLPPAKDEARRELRKQFGQLVKQVHPDQARGIANAPETFKLLTSMYDLALQAIEAGTYAKPFDARIIASAPAGTTLKSGMFTYNLDALPFAQGDFSVIYHAKIVENGLFAFVKIASAPKNNPWLEKEEALLTRFASATAGSKLHGIAEYVPSVYDFFMVPGPGGTRYRVNVMQVRSGFISLERVMQAFPAGLEPQHAAWIYRRIVGQVLSASMVGHVHCAVLPSHVLIDPIKHEPLYLGWAHAVEKSESVRVTSVSKRWKDYYPPEVFKRERFGRRSDLYMAGKTMIKLLGGDPVTNKMPSVVPAAMRDKILETVEQTLDRRPRDTKKYLDDFTATVRKIWGSEYRPLHVPGV